MTNNQNASPEGLEGNWNAAAASIWVLLLTLIGLIEIGSLFLSGSMLAAILQ